MHVAFSLFTGVVQRLTVLRGIATTTSFPRLLAHGDAIAAHDVQIMGEILYRVREVNQMPNDVCQDLLEFQVDGVPLGKVRPSIAKKLCTMRAGAGDEDHPVFDLRHDSESSTIPGTPKQYLTLSEAAGSTVESRSAAVASVMSKLRHEGMIHGWRDELYPVSRSFYDTPAFHMERAAVPLLGALEYGVHINGIVLPSPEHQNANQGVLMWMARRSKSKSKFPGMLDHVVAGGQPSGLSLLDNVIKECWEEASIPEDLTRAGLRSAGAISYETYSTEKDTVSRAVLFNFDLYLPPSFRPTPVDGEVEEFFLWSIDDILKSMERDYPDPIKPNCYLVIIDFLMRHGHLNPQVPGYLDVLRELRSGDCR